MYVAVVVVVVVIVVVIVVIAVVDVVVVVVVVVVGVSSFIQLAVRPSYGSQTPLPPSPVSVSRQRKQREQ